MQFRVPQFLDIEDKVFGPFTFKQFGYILGAGGFAYIFWKLIPSMLIAFPLILLFSGTFIALAFVKINDRPFADVLESAYKFIIGDKTMIWHKSEFKKEDFETKKIRIAEENKVNLNKNIQLKVISPEKIRELSKNLDIFSQNNQIKKEIPVSENKKETVNLREHLFKS
ncbi:MAG: PrgI family protein [Candidatus Pacebacteria bacterium]|nr:PrgI family protein [Candidatus Paceibacterota bacterium]